MIMIVIIVKANAKENVHMPAIFYHWLSTEK